MSKEKHGWPYDVIPQSPFTNEYVEQEIEFMQLQEQEDLNEDGIQVTHKTLVGRLDDYLNSRYHTGELICPVFGIDGKLWMSLTPMEVQSNSLAWMAASGKVAVGGLGIGYTALRIANKDDVDWVTVYEQDQRVVDYFLKHYRGREELDRIEFVVGDARQTFYGRHFDYVYMDIYPELLSDECQEDISLFCDNNTIGQYRFWGQELVLLQALSEEYISAQDLEVEDAAFLAHWTLSEGANMSNPHTDRHFIQDTIVEMSSFMGLQGVDELMFEDEDFSFFGGEVG